jgi:hypothetical protein
VSPVVRIAPRSGAEARPTRVHGYSLRAVVHRFLSESQAAAHHDEPVFVNAVAWAPRTAEWVYRVLVVLLLVAAALALGARPVRDAPRWLLEMSVVATSMVIVAPLARKAHYVVLLLPFVYGLAQAVVEKRRSALIWVVPPALVFLVTSPGMIGRRTAALALAWGAYTAAALWLWGGALYAARRDARAPVG